MQFASKVSSISTRAPPCVASGNTMLLKSFMRAAGTAPSTLRSASSFYSRASTSSRMAVTQAYQYEPVSGGGGFGGMGNSSSSSIEEVEFSPGMGNSISLMGNVGKKPELRHFENGSKLATWTLAFSDPKSKSTQWFNVDAWGELAEVAAAEIEKGQRIVVEGRLKVESWTPRDSLEERKSLKIIAQAVQRVRWGEGGGGGAYGGEYRSSNNNNNNNNNNWNQQSEPQQQQQQQQPAWGGNNNNNNSSTTSAASSPQSSGRPLATAEETWMSYFEDPSGWYDNRPAKVSGEINSKSPDFKRRDGGREAPALWIDSKTTPAWVRQELTRLNSGGGGGGQAQQNDAPPF